MPLFHNQSSELQFTLVKYLVLTFFQDALAEDWTSYLATVELDSRQGEISELMINNGHVRKHYSNLVPSSVPHKLFWARYFFKV